MNSMENLLVNHIECQELMKHSLIIQVNMANTCYQLVGLAQQARAYAKRGA